MNEPKLRFKADDGSQFPDWKEKKLGDITEKVVRKDANSNADVRMISQGNGFILQSNKYSRENAGQSLKKYTLLKRDEFAYNHGASKAKPYGVCYRLCESDEARVPYVYHTFKLIDGDSIFWNYSLNTSCMDRQLKKMVSSGARMDGLLNIGYDAYMSVNIHVPSLPEQQKIAEFLSTIDTVIEKQKETVSAWEERKKGVMQKLFSQEVRFKADDGSDFPGWKDGRLGELCSYRRGSFPQPYGAEEWYDEENGKPFIQVADVGDSMKLLPDTKRHISKAAMPMSVFVEAGTLIVTLQGSIGRIAITDYDAYIDRTLLIIQNIDAKLKKEFLQYALSVLFADEKKRADGGTIKTITKETLTNFIFKFPCIAEQQKIADCLSSLDEVIEKQKATLAAWEELKKGLLQQMFV